MDSEEKNEDKDEVVYTERLLISTSAALLDENAPVLKSQQLNDVKVCAELLRCIPVTNKLGADDTCALISLSLVFIKLLRHHKEHSVTKELKSTQVTAAAAKLSDTVRGLMEVLLTSLQFQSREMWNHLNVRGVINTVDSCCSENWRHMQLLSDMIVKVFSSQDMFSKHTDFFENSFEEFLGNVDRSAKMDSKNAELPGLNRKILLSLVQLVSSQPKTTGNSHHKWMKKCTKKLVSAMKKKKLRIGDALHEDLLTWLSATMEQCSDVADDITKLVIHQSSLNQKTHKLTDSENSAVFVYLSSWFSCSAVHNTDLYDTVAVWCDVILAHAAGSAALTTTRGSGVTDKQHSSVYERLLLSFLSALSKSELESCLVELHNMLHKDLVGNLSKALTVWRVLLDHISDLNKDRHDTVEKYCKQFVSESFRYLSALHCGIHSYSTESTDSTAAVAMQSDLYIQHINLLTHVISKGKTYAEGSDLAAILSSIQLVDLKSAFTGRDLSLPVSCFQRFIQATLLHHESAAGNSKAQLMQITNKAVISRSSRSEIHVQYQVDNNSSDDDIIKLETDMLTCCQELNKIYGLMSDYPKVFSKISGFMLADVMSFLQSVTLLPSVKKALYLALNGLLDLVDEYSDLMLKTNMPEAQREIYKTVYEQYNKYHKYSGKV